MGTPLDGFEEFTVMAIGVFSVTTPPPHPGIREHRAIPIAEIGTRREWCISSPIAEMRSPRGEASTHAKRKKPWRKTPPTHSRCVRRNRAFILAAQPHRHSKIE